MYLLAPFILQNVKKNSWGQSRAMTMCYFRDQNGPFIIKIFFWYKPLLLLPSTYWPFSLCKILKNSYGGSRVMRMHQIFFWKIINIILIYLLAPFIGQNLKKILPADPELWGCAIFGPKMAHFPKWEFFSENLLMSLVSFIHAYLQAKNQSQILIY